MREGCLPADALQCEALGFDLISVLFQLTMLWEQSFQLLRFGTYAQLSSSYDVCLPSRIFFFSSLFFFPFKVNFLKLVYKVMEFLMAFSYVCAIILTSNLSLFLFTFNMIIFFLFFSSLWCL